MGRDIGRQDALGLAIDIGITDAGPVFNLVQWPVRSATCYIKGEYIKLKFSENIHSKNALRTSLSSTGTEIIVFLRFLYKFFN